MTQGSEFAIIGAGGHGRVVASTLRAAGHEPGGFYDDDPAKWGRTISGVQVWGPIGDMVSSRVSRAVIAIGDNATRRRVAAGLSLDWVTVVHPMSWVAPEASVGPGTVVCAGTIVQPDAVVGAHVILNSNSVIEHDARVADHVHLASALFGAGASVGEGTLLGMGSIVLPELIIGPWATVGAGAVVTRDVDPDVTVVGIPARPITREP